MADSDVGSREQVLGRIRAALRVSAAPSPDETPQGAIFAAVPDLLRSFQEQCAANLSELVLTSSEAASAKAIENVLAELPDGEIYVQEAPELRRISAGWMRPMRWSSEGAAAETSQATITLAEAFVAATGSVLVSSACGGRSGSIVAACHIVLGKYPQLVPDLETALTQAAKRGITQRNSFVGLITGSSRTADIEKVLVMGAHGPRRLVVILQRD